MLNQNDPAEIVGKQTITLKELLEAKKKQQFYQNKKHSIKKITPKPIRGKPRGRG